MAQDFSKIIKWVRIRIVMVVCLMIMASIAILIRAFDLQVARGEEFRKKAMEQQIRTAILPPSRGAILDRNGSPMAVSIMVPSIYANTEDIENIEKTTGYISKILDTSEEKLSELLKSKKGFVWIKRRVTEEEAKKIKELSLPGINITYESKRFYPNRNVASHVIGMSGYDAQGLEGLEYQYDKELKGPKPVITGLRDAAGRMIFSSGINEENMEREKSIVLTIDKAIQSIVEKELEYFVRLFEAKSASLVMVRPSTGEILAMANYPDFDPNFYWESSPELRRNRAVTDRFEPGSTMKIFTMSAALDMGLIKLSDLFYCYNGEMRIGDLVIRDSHRNGWLTPIQILQKSSNVGISQIAFMIGKEKLYQVLTRFGFGSKTEIPFPGETSGFLRHYREWYDVDLASISFGHGIGVSVLQLAMAVSAIANGGKLLKPLLVKSVVSSNGSRIKEYTPKVVRKVIEPRTAKIIARMMVAVTQQGGTGTEAAIPGFEVSGKTGTAQKPDTISGGYSTDKWIASFVGFVPTEDPQIAMAIMFDEPTISYYGGVVAAPVFRRVAEKTLKILGVTPNKSLFGDKNLLTTIQQQGTDDNREDNSEGGIELGNGSIQNNEDEGGGEQGGMNSQDTNDNECSGDCVVVPSFNGLSLREAILRASSTGIEIIPQGVGRATQQSIASGIKVPRGAKVTVTFVPPSVL